MGTPTSYIIIDGTNRQTDDPTHNTQNNLETEPWANIELALPHRNSDFLSKPFI